VSRARAEWRGRAAFAEFAEALGVTTRDVMAVHGGADVVVVLYSTEHRADPRATPVRWAKLRRDRAGVLELVDDGPAGTFGEYVPEA
jgi:hypothetical protein